MPTDRIALVAALQPRLARVPADLRQEAAYQLSRFATTEVPWLSMSRAMREALEAAEIVAWDGGVMLDLANDPAYKPLPRLSVNS